MFDQSLHLLSYQVSEHAVMVAFSIMNVKPCFNIFRQQYFGFSVVSVLYNMMNISKLDIDNKCNTAKVDLQRLYIAIRSEESTIDLS